MDFSDPLLNAFKRLRVLESHVDERAFKLAALDALRNSKVYKWLKLKPLAIRALERNLVQEHLSPLAFASLCALFDTEVAVVNRRFHYVCGVARYAVRGVSVGRIGNLDTFEYCPAKPLYAVSHYTLAELRVMASKFQLRDLGTKTALYAAISNEIAKIESSEL